MEMMSDPLWRCEFRHLAQLDSFRPLLHRTMNAEVSYLGESSRIKVARSEQSLLDFEECAD